MSCGGDISKAYVAQEVRLGGENVRCDVCQFRAARRIEIVKFSLKFDEVRFGQVHCAEKKVGHFRLAPEFLMNFKQSRR